MREKSVWISCLVIDLMALAALRILPALLFGPVEY